MGKPGPWRLATSVVALAALGVSARAEPPATRPPREPVRVRLEVPAECFDGERFLREVSARTDRIRPASAAEPARTFVPAVRRVGAGFEGRLTLEEDGHETRPRMIRADSCEQALHALAFIAALSVDPEARAAPDSGQSPASSSSEAPDGASASQGAPLPLASAGTLTRPERIEKQAAAPAASTTGAATAAEQQSTPVVDAPSYGLAAGGGAQAISPRGFTGSVFVGPSIFVGAVRARSGAIALDARLSGARIPAGSVTTAVGTASLVLTSATVSICPVGTSDRLLTACADTEAGALEVDTTGAGTRGTARAWVAPGLAGRLSWPPSTADSPTRWFLELEVGLRVPLLRDTIYFLDHPNNYQVYSAPTVVPRSAVDLGIRFW